ncbi:MAG: Ig-like domain-containing protein [Thermoplasmata archaeon]|nr:Ig-like domain-containing protein [Thermoplasmata archaeon]
MRRTRFPGSVTMLLATMLLVHGGILSQSMFHPPASPGPQFSPLGNVYYVSPTGNNSNPGTLSKPWATPGYGSRQLQPGDTLVILGGRYNLSTEEDIILPENSGMQNAWITIRGEEGHRPVLAGQDNLRAGVDLSGKRYIVLENIEITSNDGAMFRDGIAALDGSAENIVLREIYIHHIDEFGLNMADVNELKILNCTISHCGFGSIGGPAGVEGGWRNVTIRNCSLAYAGWYYQGNYYTGPDVPDVSPYDRPDGFGIETSNGPIEIANSLIAFNLGDGLDSKSNNTYIHECVVANNRCDGIKLWGTGSKAVNTLIYGRGGGNMTPMPWSAVVIHTEYAGSTFELTNLAIDDFVGENYLMHVQYDNPTTQINLTVRNTIFCARGQNSGIFIAGAVDLVMESCLFYMPNCTDNVVQFGSTVYNSTEIGSTGTGNLYGDPRFLNPAAGTGGNYHLQPGSPAIDNGTATGAPGIDLDGVSRPQGDGYDIGAYEHLSNGTDTVKPTVMITYPSDGAVLTNTSVVVTGTASDNVAIQKVEVSVDGANWLPAVGTSLWMANLTLHEGTNTIHARATDPSGNTQTTTITVTVSTAVQEFTPGPWYIWLIWGCAVIVSVLIIASIIILLRHRKKP